MKESEDEKFLYHQYHSISSIEKATKLDDSQLDQILKIQKVCQLSEWTRNDYQIESERHNSVFLIAKNRNQRKGIIKDLIIGFILLRVNRIVGTDTRCIEADLLNFGVSEEFQKQGIGDILFKESRSILCTLKVNLIWLEVRESNITAIKFYRKRGFTNSQIRKNFYTQPIENAVLMRLEL